MEKDAKIYVAGHAGLVGSALVRTLQAAGFSNLVFSTRIELDLTNQGAVAAFFEKEKPEYVFLAAARVGGIVANEKSKADFLRDNLLIQTNVIHEAWRNGTKKLLFLGSSCIYPKNAPQPMREDSFMTGPLETTNDAYAIAKIAGVYLCWAYRQQHGFNAIAAMPTNLYGPNDNFDLQDSHVIPALIRKFHEAKTAGSPSVTVWGTGTPRREFLHADDLAQALLLLMERHNEPDIINVGTGEDCTIAELAHTIAEVTGYAGKIEFDPSKPDGMPQKLLNVDKIHSLGWSHTTSLVDGLKQAYLSYLSQN